jgi:hypothetical protein
MPTHFSPAIRIIDGVQIYTDGSVTAQVESFGRNLIIRSLASAQPGLGNSSRAIEWLRSEGFSWIEVQGFGSVERGEEGNNTPLQAYWLHMQAKGLVDLLVTDDRTFIGKQPEDLDQDPEDEIDDLSLRRMLNAASERLDRMLDAWSSVSPSTAGENGRRKLQAYAVLKAFSAGRLKNQEVPLEDSDDLYDMLDTNPDRHAAITDGIFALSREHSEQAALSLLKSTRGVGLAAFDMGWATAQTFLYNPTTGQVLSANGVMDLLAIRRGRETRITSPEDASKLAQKGTTDPGVLCHFGRVAELMCELQDIRPGSPERDDSPSP